MPIAEINALKDCFVEQLSPLSVYLFGSYADGSFDEDSDLDFYIVVDDSHTDMLSLISKAYKSVRGVRTRPVDILVGTKSKFDELKHSPTVENEVFRKGVMLYGS